MRTGTKLGSVLLAIICGSPAAAIDVSLGASSELLTLYGLGPSSNPALGTFAVGQGSSSFDGTTSTFTLSGAITGGDAGFNTGTYEFVTTYAASDTPQAGANAPSARSNAMNLLFFNYTSLDPSTTITLFLDTPSQDYVIPLFADDNFVPGSNFFFLFANTTCTGVVTCNQNLVGLTPGATIFGPTTLTASFTVANPVNGVPEPSTWAMLTVAFGAVGVVARRRRFQVVG